MSSKLFDLVQLNLPSPVQQLSSPLLEKKQIKLYVKRDDLIHPLLSGNKWRKLKYNLLEAEKLQKKKILTFGGAYSNHIHATAAAGKLFGFDTVGIIRGESYEPLNPTLSFAKEQGMLLDYLNRKTYRLKNTPEVISRLKEKYGDFYLVPEGGSNQMALPGCAEIINELNEQLEGKFDYICTACGSGGTLAGLISSAEKQKMLGFAVLKGADFLNEDVTSLLGNTSPPNWQINLNYHFGGYAKKDQQLSNFCRDFENSHNIFIEPTYTGKMFFGLFDLIKKDFFIKNSTIVALHTGGLQGKEIYSKTGS